MRGSVEEEILLTEAAGRSNGVNANLLLWRYGAQGRAASSAGGSPAPGGSPCCRALCDRRQRGG
ncbi:hypothetical protein GCM10027452_02270 [Micromonospora halotolerans]